MKEKKKFVITANHVLTFGGLAGSLLVIISMGIHWVRFGTPFFYGAALFGNPLLDTLITLAWPLAMFFWGLSEMRKNKQKDSETES